MMMEEEAMAMKDLRAANGLRKQREGGRDEMSE
jgi:hypothetical protein